MLWKNKPFEKLLNTSKQHLVLDCMKEKECWTLGGRKKIFLVDDENNVVKELKDLGPLSEIELKWVKSNSGMPYEKWLKLQTEKNEKEAVEDTQ
jgi:hypothetical protein